MLYPADFVKYYQEQGWWTADTFATFFHDAAQQYGDALALVGTDVFQSEHRWTYSELAQRIDATAQRLKTAGVQPHDYVVVQLPNLVEYVLVVGAVLRLGARPIFTLPAHRYAELDHFITESRATMLVTVDSWIGFSHRELADQLCSQHPSLQVMICEDEGFATADAEDKQLSPAAPVATDIAFLQVSGGTTGTPKLIPRSHADYLYSVRESAKICELDTATVFLVVLPVSHNFTMSSPGILGVWYSGGTVVLCTDPSPSVAFDLITQERVTLAAVVPPLALAWLSMARILKPDLSSLQVLQVGGAKFTPEAARRIQPELGCRLQQVFGMAEGLVNYTRTTDPEELVIHSQGRPTSPGDEIRVVDAHDNEVESGQPGLLLTRGPYTIRSYFHGVDAESFTKDGFYRTGDVVKVLPSGHLVVLGRDKDQINRGGEKISAEEIEDHLIAHPAVFDAAIIAVPDSVQGEKCYAFIVTNEGHADVQAAELRSFLRQRVADYKIPDFFEFASAFPTTGVGKTSRKELRVIVTEHILNKENHD